MEKSLEDMLYELQRFECSSIDLCKMKGNGLGEPWWRIRYIQTVGGEKFAFFQISMGMQGSGIYKDTVKEAEAYAKECVIGLFKTAARAAKVLPSFDANEYDWRIRGSIYNDL